MNFSKLKEIPKEEYLASGHVACQGCSATLGLRLALKVLGKNTIVINGSGCMTLLPIYPLTPFKVPWVHLAIENVGAAGIGLYYGLKRRGIDAKILCHVGDGATYDIGLQSLSAAAEQNIDMIYICYNNQSYGNTGHQRASSTPMKSITSTTPSGKLEEQKDLPLIMAAHKIPYVATAVPSYPLDFLNKVEKASKIKGLKYIDLLTPCPVGWGFDPSNTIKVGELAVQTGIHRLYEIKNSVLTITYVPKKRKKVAEYLKMQGRFSHLTKEDLEEIQDRVDKEWERLEKEGYSYKLFLGELGANKQVNKRY
ncbi:MAG: thiamine pyrophosphate-dependent enzyme [Methanosarcinales archaeon]